MGQGGQVRQGGLVRRGGLVGPILVVLPLLFLLSYYQISVISYSRAVVIDGLEFECDVLVIISPPCHSSAVCY